VALIVQRLGLHLWLHSTAERQWPAQLDPPETWQLNSANQVSEFVSPSVPDSGRSAVMIGVTLRRPGETLLTIRS
jgi:hypothetical protein